MSTSTPSASNTFTLSHSRYHKVPLQHFSQSDVENCELCNLSVNVFQYMLLKIASHKHSIILPDICQFLLLSNNVTSQPSNIHYMELINENADSKDTLLNVAEDLIDIFKDTHQEWVVLVGDGKTYQHLMSIKQEYGETLNKLLIFPGDWHTMKSTTVQDYETLLKSWIHGPDTCFTRKVQ